MPVQPQLRPYSVRSYLSALQVLEGYRLERLQIREAIAQPQRSSRPAGKGGAIGGIGYTR